jgi:uncharacterized damage-inducible protein DinB
MTAKDAIRYSLNMNSLILKKALEDLGDADLLARPAPGANHIAWQLGHLIASQVRMIVELGGTAIDLPPGFAEKHTKETAGKDTSFLKKDEYLALYDKTQAATLTALDKATDADLDRPTGGPMKDFAPKHGDLFSLAANHIMMHAGQFSVVRRKLGKPVLF